MYPTFQKMENIFHQDDQRVILQKNNSRWHTDSSYRYHPASFSILFGQETLPQEAIGGKQSFLIC